MEMGRWRKIMILDVFQDLVEEEVNIEGRGFPTGNTVRRLCLILECCIPHDYSPKFKNLITLQRYILLKKKNEIPIPEVVVLKIFFHMLTVVNGIHEVSKELTEIILF